MVKLYLRHRLHPVGDSRKVYSRYVDYGGELRRHVYTMDTAVYTMGAKFSTLQPTSKVT